MKKMACEWLIGWEVIAAPAAESSLCERYGKELELMQLYGKKLFLLGTLPSLAGTDAPKAFQDGTGGNLAQRSISSPYRFIVTRMGAHKGRLQKEDFVEVEFVDWTKQKIYVRRDKPQTLPSTDTLLVAAVFESHPLITTWIHFHRAVNTPFSARIQYPSLDSTDRKKLSSLIDSGAGAINMIDHDLFVKKIPDGTADAAIVIGENPKETFDRALYLARQ